MVFKNTSGLLGTGRFLFLIIISIAFLAFISACGSDKDGDKNVGTVSIGLTDASTDEYKAVYVTINDVEVHMSGGSWEVIGSPEKTYNLLELVNGIIAQLGIAQLDPGDYTQIRLIIGEEPDDEPNILGDPHPYANYIIDTADVEHKLKVPSGYKTGIKLVHEFTVNEGATVELVLDFDAYKSVVKAGKSGKWILKPTIKVIDVEEAYTLSGIVSGVSGVSDNPLTGVLVSAQVFDDSAADKKDEVIIQASTITNGNGEYAMLVEPGVYNIVAYKDGYISDPDCTNVIVESGSGGPEPKDFVLDTMPTGTVSGNVVIDSGVTEATAFLSFRQNIQCENLVHPEAIEIKSIIVPDGEVYSGVTLPVGTYNLVASSDGEDTQVFTDIEITEGNDTMVDVTFP